MHLMNCLTTLDQKAVHSLKKTIDVIASSVAPPPDLTVSEWADAERVLSSEASAEAGKWHTSSAEYQRGIMDAFNEAGCKSVTVMGCSQFGKTEIILNLVGRHIDIDPCPILVLQPTLDMATTWSKDRLSPMIRDTHVLQGKVKDARSRDSGNTILHKTFAGGHITMAGSNSPASLASRPIRVVLCDEVDRYPVSAGTEGDPINLAKKRTAKFWNRILGYFSTPTIKGESRIEELYEASDQRRRLCTCPHCQEEQELTWEFVKWDSDDPSTAAIMCRHCGVLWTDAERIHASQNGRWQARKEYTGHIGFFINSLYLPWTDLGDLVADFLEAKRMPETLKTFINTELGETWEDKGETVKDDGLMNRREAYDRDNLPDDVLLLTMGADVQGDRIEAECVGWGRDEESWGVEYRVFYGDPNNDEVWNDFDEWLLGKFTTESGRVLRIEAGCVDAGYLQDRVLRFTGPRKRRRIWAVKGAAGAGRPLWPKRASRAANLRAMLHMLGVDTGKEIIYSRLRMDKEEGAGVMHFPMDYDGEYFKQLTAETVRTKHIKGHKVREWHKKRDRNEALDVRVYGMAAMIGRNIDLNKRYDKIMSTDAVEEDTREEQQEPIRGSRRRVPARRRGGFVRNY